MIRPEMRITGAISRMTLRSGAGFWLGLMQGSISSSQELSEICRVGQTRWQHRASEEARLRTVTGGEAVFRGAQTEKGLCGSLLVRCPDGLGIVAGISDCLSQHGSSILAADLYVNKGERKGSPDTFVCRFFFGHPDSSLEESVSDLVAHFGAHASLILPGGRQVILEGIPGCPVRRTVLRESGLPRVGVFMSKTEHCLLALLNRVKEGDLPVDIRYVISNHPRDTESQSHVRRW